MTRAYRCDTCERTWREVAPFPAPSECPVCDRPGGDSGLRRRSQRARRAFRTLRDFYAADSSRRLARERDFGLWWRDRPDEPVRRLAWIESTGELYLAESGDPSEGGGRVEVLAVVEDPSLIERALKGWQRVCGSAGSLRWLRRHSAALLAGA
jgi:hypothetical protein